MAEIIPFKGILYNVSKVSIEEVLAPPYDIITPEYQETLYKRNPFNIVRVDYGKDMPGDNDKENRYTRAKKYLEEWIYKGILVQSPEPSFYLYSMNYEIDEQNKQLIGFMGLIRLEELGKGNIYPHECTYSPPKEDRLNLLRTCGANISPIFSLYKDAGNQLSELFSRIIKSKPYMKSKDDAGSIHRLWQVDKEKDIAIIRADFKDKPIFIADGHHRYETALEYKKEMKRRRLSHNIKEPFDYVLMFFSNMLNEGLTILPTHRLIKEIPADINKMLSKYFTIETVNEDFDIARKMSGKTKALGFFKNDAKKWYILHFREDILSEIRHDLRDIDVIVLHDLVLEKILKVKDIDYEMDIQKALVRVRNRQYDAVFFLNPTRVGDVEKAALSSIRMPPKSTYFYPKLLTGAVINRFSQDNRAC